MSVTRKDGGKSGRESSRKPVTVGRKTWEGKQSKTSCFTLNTEIIFRAGYLFGLLKLERELEVEVLSSRSLHCLCEKVIESGKRSRREVEFPGDLPLYYEYHSKPYLGKLVFEKYSSRIKPMLLVLKSSH